MSKYIIEYDQTIYKPIPGYREYITNEDGSSIKRIASEVEIRKPQLKATFHKDKGKEYPSGYWYVTLLSKDYASPNGLIYDNLGLHCVAVHRLVALTYCIQAEPEDIWINHENGNKIDNHYTNLKWGTISYNIQHSVDTGLRVIKSGADHWRTGQPVSKKVRKLMSEAKKGTNHPKYKGSFVTPKGIFQSGNAMKEVYKHQAKVLKGWCIAGINGFSFIPKGNN